MLTRLTRSAHPKRLARRFMWSPLALAAACLCGVAPVSHAQVIRPDPQLTAVTVTVGSTVVRSGQTNPLSMGYSVGFPDFAATDFTARTYSKLPETYIFSDPVNKVYSQKILDALNVPGTVFRLNQGLLDWQRAIARNRKPLIDSDTPTSMRGIPTTWVGLDEYLQFVERVKGVPLIVLNLQAAYEDLPDGSFALHAPINVSDPADPYWPVIVKREAALLEYLNAPANADWVGDGVRRGAWRPSNHTQPYDVWNFELDNETNLAGQVFRLPNGDNASVPIVRSLRPEEFVQRASAVVAAMRTVAHNGGNQEGRLRFIAQTVTPVANALAHSFDPNVLTNGVSEPLWPTQPTQSIFGYWNRAMLNGTASLSMDWSGVAKIPSWVPTSTYDSQTQVFYDGMNIDICGDTTPAHQVENAAWCATQYFNFTRPHGAQGSPRSDGFYSPVANVPGNLTGLGPYLSSVGIHTYYDSPFWGHGEFNYWWAHELPMMSLLPVDLTNESVKAWGIQTGWTGSLPKVSITEYGRDLVRGEDGNAQHPQLTGIYAAVASSELAIASAYRPYVDMMVHNGLAGPWSWWGQFAKVWRAPSNLDTTTSFQTNPPTWFNQGDGTYEFQLRAEARAINLVGQALYRADVLNTSIDTPAAQEGKAVDFVARSPSSFYGEFVDTQGSSLGYDVRAVGLQYPGNGNKGVLAINRAEPSYPLQLVLPGLASGDRRILRVQSVGGSGLLDTTDPAQDPYVANPNYGNTWTRYVAVSFSGSPVQTQLNLPGHAVYSATVVGNNLLNNADFETAIGSTWTANPASGSNGTCSVTNTATDRVNGLSGLSAARLMRGTATGCALSQGSGSNAALASSGELGQRPYDTYVLRGNARVSPGADGIPVKTTANAGGLAARINNVTVALASAAQSDPATTAGHGWAAMQAEFVPYASLKGAALTSSEVQVTSTVPSLDIDGVSLLRRPNQVLDPAFATLPNSGTKWQRSVPGSLSTKVASISLLSLSSPVRVQFRQASVSSNVVVPMTLLQNATLQGSSGTALKPGGALDTGRQDLWRLKAQVGFSGLNGAGAVLKVKLFNAAGALINDTVQGAYTRQNGVPCSGSSPAPVLQGTSSGVYEVCLDFRPADIIGSNTYGGAELSLQYLDATLGGTLDVHYMSLERLAD